MTRRFAVGLAFVLLLVGCYDGEEMASACRAGLAQAKTAADSLRFLQEAQICTPDGRGEYHDSRP